MAHVHRTLLHLARAGLRRVGDGHERRRQEAEAFRVAKARFDAAAVAAHAAYVSSLDQDSIDLAARRGPAELRALLTAERDRIQALGARLCAEAGLDQWAPRGKLLLGRFVARLGAEVSGRFDLHGLTFDGHPTGRFPLP